MDNYEQREAIIKQQLFATVSNSLVIELSSLTLTKASEVWNAILARYQGKSEIFKMNIHQQLTNLKCQGEDNIRAYLAEATHLKETLAGMGHIIVPTEYNAIITTALPESYRPIIAAVSASSVAIGKPLETAQLLALIEEQYNSKPHKSMEDNVALFSKSSGRG